MSRQSEIEEMLGEVLGGKARILGGMRMPEQKSGNGYDVTILPEAQVLSLKEKFEAYKDVMEHGPKFKAGDLVHPKPGNAIKGGGQPHIVLETRATSQAAPLFCPGQASAPSNGVRQDMRVAVFVDDEDMFAFWVESYEYEHWNP